MIRIFSFKMYTNLLEKKFLVGQVNQHQHRDTWLEFMTHIQWLKQCHSQCDPLRDSETESMKLVRDLGTVLKCRPEIPTRAKVKNLSSKPSFSKLFQAQMNSLISLKWTRLISKTNFLPKRYQDHIRCPGLFSRTKNEFLMHFTWFWFNLTETNSKHATFWCDRGYGTSWCEQPQHPARFSYNINKMSMTHVTWLIMHEYEIQKRKMGLWRWKTNVKNRIIFESEKEFKNWIRDGLKSGFKIRYQFLI